MSISKILAFIPLAAGLLAGCADVDRTEKGTAAVTEKTPHIIAKTADADKYVSLNGRFAKAFEFLKRPDLASLPAAQYDIIPGECWAIVQEADLKPCEQKQFEAHRKYIDIQTPLTGEETLGLYTMDAQALAAEFDVEKDYCLFMPADKAAAKFVTLKPGEFAIFFPPLGAHAPGCTSGEERKIKKLVIKVLAD